MMALNVSSFSAVLILHSSTFTDQDTLSTILLSCALSWDFQSFIFNSKVAYYCLYVIFVKGIQLGSDALGTHSREDVDIAISRALRNQSRGFRALLYVSLPIYLCFLVGAVAAILVLIPLIITTLWLHFFGNERNSNTILSGIIEAHQDNQYNNHRPQSDVIADIV